MVLAPFDDDFFLLVLFIKLQRNETRHRNTHQDTTKKIAVYDPQMLQGPRKKILEQYR